MKNKFFLAVYDLNDNIISTYENIQDYCNKNNIKDKKEIQSCKNSIYQSIYHTKKK